MKVLIAIDGSPFSTAAVQKCAQMLPNRSDTEVKLISVYEKLGPMVAEPFGVSNEYYREAEHASRKLAEEAVINAGDQLREQVHDMKFTIESEVERGRASRVIVEAAADWKADLIVLGSHGYGFWERNLLGSVSDSVVHHAPCSVLIVRMPAKAD
ncbi:MAG: universal stress protein [Pyrinomonadaceae bacterium]|nr:universal stress protein [Pyrinomonadaceae bacterium]